MVSDRTYKYYFKQMKDCCFINGNIDEENLKALLSYLDINCHKIFTRGANMSYENVIVLQRWFLSRQDIKVPEWFLLKILDYCKRHSYDDVIKNIMFYIMVEYTRLMSDDENFKGVYE